MGALNKIRTKSVFSCGVLLLSGISILMFQNCGGGFESAGALSASSSNGLISGLVLGAAKQTVPTGGSVQMSISGGTVPYTYTVSSGTITPTGMYTAPASISGSSLHVTVTGVDSTNMTGSYTLTVTVGLSIIVTYSPSSPTRGGAVSISASNGVAPYTYYMQPGSASGAGAISSTYTAGSAVGTDTIQVTDANGDVQTVSIPIN